MIRAPLQVPVPLIRTTNKLVATTIFEMQLGRLSKHTGLAIPVL